MSASPAVARFKPSVWRQVLAAILVLVFALGGLERGYAAAFDHGRAGTGPFPICHAGSGHASAPRDRGGAGHHDCCDVCALCAPVLLASPPDVAEPLLLAVADAEPTRKPDRSAAIARPRAPRQSRGPPRRT